MGPNSNLLRWDPLPAGKALAEMEIADTDMNLMGPASVATLPLPPGVGTCAADLGPIAWPTT